MQNQVLVIGHRGASAYLPDNTIESFQQALIDKADMIELDVRRSVDGELVLYHDWYVQSEFGISKPAALATSEEIGRFCLSRGIKLATLDEVLSNFAGKIKINIELKAGGYEIDVLNAVYKYGIAADIVMSSFFPWVILKLKDLDSNIKTGWIVGQEQVLFLNRFGGPPVEMLFKYMKAESIHLHYKIITKRLVKTFHSRGVPVYAWTVDDIALTKKLIQMGVDGLITNKPGQLHNLLYRQLDIRSGAQAYTVGIKNAKQK
jgi:glycerophosphoryl diester phosphodiesterase